MALTTKGIRFSQTTADCSPNLASGNLAKPAGQLGNMLEHPNLSPISRLTGRHTVYNTFNDKISTIHVHKCLKTIAGEGEPVQAAGAGGARRRVGHLWQPGPVRFIRGEGSSGAERVGPQRLLQLGRHRAQRDLQRRRHRRGMERGSCLSE